jgi:putative ABC transport system permease protein
MGFAERIYRRFPTVLMARRNLTRTTLRSVLAALGIVIGVVAIASLGILGATLQSGVLGSLGGIGNEVVVSPAADAGVERLNDRDIREIRRAASGTVTPVKRDQAVLSYGRERRVVSVLGMENPAGAYNATEGRVPDPFRSGALVGASLAEGLDLEPGNSITVGNETYRVVGVLASQGGFSTVNPDSAVVLPANAVAGTGWDQAVVSAETGQAANESALAIREALNRRSDRVSVFELASITDQIGQVFGLLNTFLLAVGSISLVVAGVSILNVMLMSTIERRGEIGVLRAVGYQKRDVLKVLLAEAALLGALGGLVGVVFSLGVGLVVAQVMLSDPLAVLEPGTAIYLPLAFLFGVVTSMVAGLYPAWKAANERPVEALRN